MNPAAPMKRSILALSALLVLSIVSSLLAETIDPYSWIYEALRSFESIGLVHLEPTLPYDRSRVETYVREISSQVEEEKIELSDRQRFLLDRLKREFLSGYFAPEARDDKPISVIREEDRFAAVDASLGCALIKEAGISQGEIHGLGEAGMLVGFENIFDLQARYRIAMEPERGANVDGGHPGARTRSFRGLSGEFDRGVLSARGKRWEVRLGREYLHWGADPGEGLLLSRNAGSLDHIGGRIEIGKFALSVFHAVLGEGAIGEGAKKQIIPRRLAGHRLTVALPHDIYFGVGESVLYASYGVEWAYLLPVSIFYVNQANERTNDDNILYSFDVKVPVSRGIFFTAELLVDDIQYERDSRAGPDRIAYAMRIEARKVLKRKEFALACRYTRVDKFTYEHASTYSGVNTSFVSGDGNYPIDALIGSTLGPDADRWDVSLYCGAAARVDLDIGASFTRRGEGNALEPWSPGKDRNPPFPSGSIEHEKRFSATFSYDLGRSSRLSASCGLRWICGPSSLSDRKDEFGRLEILLDL